MEKTVIASVTAVCLNGERWELRNTEEELLETLNPTNATTSRQVHVSVEEMLESRESRQDAGG